MRIPVLIFVLAAAATAQTSAPTVPKPAKPVKISAKNVPIDVTGGHAAPLVVDWNKDGKKDLLVGEYGDGGGKLRVYLNRGEDRAPAFDDFTYVKAGGEIATVPSS